MFSKFVSLEVTSIMSTDLTNELISAILSNRFSGRMILILRKNQCYRFYNKKQNLITYKTNIQRNKDSKCTKL